MSRAAVHFAAYTPVQGDTETLPNTDRLFLILGTQPCNHTAEGELPHVLLCGVSLGDTGPVGPNALAFLYMLCARQKGEENPNKTRSRVPLSSGGMGKGEIFSTAIILVICSGLNCWTQTPRVTDPRLQAELNLE